MAGHLSAMTVVLGKPEALYVATLKRLGPDPLREDADPASFFAACAGISNKKSIGAVLMDQKLIAGVGNIYRSETLYEVGIHPEQPANTLTAAELLRLWAVIMKQMQQGFRTGSIWGKKKGPECYGLQCSACGGKVKEWIMGGRNVYACAVRQKLEASRKPLTLQLCSVRPGTKHLGRMVPAAVAEARKRSFGESLAVQHVALKDDATRAGSLAAAAARKRPAAAVGCRAAKRKRVA